MSTAPPAGTGTGPGTVAQGQGWSRLHPLTPLLRGWRTLLLLLGAFGQQGLRDTSVRTLLLGLGAAVPVALALGTVSWLTTRYRVTAGELQVNTGVLQRRSRRVPLARLQSVDVVRPLLARVLGVTELRLEVAGGARTEAPLAYLGEQDASRLRRRLLAARPDAAGAAGDDSDTDTDTDTGAGTDSGTDTEAVLVAVPTGALVVSVLLGAPAVVLALLAVLLVVLLVTAPSAVPGVAAALVPAALGTGGQVGRRLLSEYAFTVAEAPDGLRLRHGLLDTRAQTIPYGRVQTVRVSEPLLWRRLGWVRVEVDVAGYARGGESSTAALLPVAPRAVASALVDRVLGAPVPLASEPVPRRARWRAPLSARRLRTMLDDRHLVVARGVLTTTTDVVPLAKVQSLRLLQGPWQRRLRLASVAADTAGRRLPGGVARHRDAAEAQALLVELTARARRARRR